jgi:TusA-related sulfurtransferase
MSDTDVSKRFLDRLSVRDFDGMAALFAPDAQARFLLPRGPETQLGGADIVTRFRDWFAAASEFTVSSTEVDEIGGRARLGWELRVVRGGPPEEIQQVAFIDTGADGILRLDLLCSGFHPVAADAVACEVAVFDAGDLGCADGLADEFRRRLSSVPVGGSLRVIAADPAAKEDLPPLARMLGHTVKATGTLPDGRLAITVERAR